MTRGDLHRIGRKRLHQQRNNLYYSYYFGSDSHAYHETGGAHHHTSHGGHVMGGGHGAMDATFIWKLSKLGRIGSSRLRFDDDFADRLNYQFSGFLMFLFIGIIGIRQYVGKPIQCWIPQEFTRGWEEYAENYCWVSNTYFNPLSQRLTPAIDKSASLIVYYQWAPILMAIQALLFYLPCLIWRLFNSRSGYNVRRIMQMASDSNILLPEHGIKNVRFIARYMEGCIYRQRDYRKYCKKSNLYKTTSTFPYQTSYQTGEQQASVSQQQVVQPPPNYSANIQPAVHDHHMERFNKPESSKPINGDASVPLNFSRRHRRRKTFCKRLKCKMPCAQWFKAFTQRRRKPTTNSILNSPPNSGRISMPCEHLDNTRWNSKGCLQSCKFRNWCCGKRNGNYLVVLYFIVKMIYLINIIGQLVLMEKFIGNKYSFYGLRVLLDLIQGTEWYTSGNFPRVTFCEFEAKKLGKNHKYVIQCVLPLNMFLEKIFIFLWFWHCLLGIITMISFINWFLKMGFARYRLKFIRKFLKIMSVMKETDKTTSKKFVESFLRPDGVFLIRLIAMNIGDMIAGDLVCELWHMYRHKRAVEADDLKYIEPVVGHLNIMGQHHLPRLSSLSQTEFGVFSAPSRDKIMLNINNGNDDSIV